MRTQACANQYIDFKGFLFAQSSNNVATQPANADRARMLYLSPHPRAEIKAVARSGATMEIVVKRGP
jgi:hypothetical protein